MELLTQLLNRITIKDRAFLSRQLATMLNSGIPLVEAVKILIQETKNPVVKESLTEIARDLESGLTFSGAIEKQPNLFNNIYVAIVRSGEASGKLEEVLLQLADNMEKENSLVGKIKGAMVYPIFIITAMIGVAILMMVRVMPQLKGIFEESKVELPFTTRVLLASSDFMVKYWWLVVAAMIGSLIGLRFWLKTPNGTFLLNKLQLRIPGGFSEGIYMSRFTRTMSLLIKAGLPIIEALKITGEVMNNIVYKDSLEQASSQVERGLPLSAPLGQDERLYPTIVSSMILVGEQTGRLDTLLEKLAIYYDDEMNEKVKGLSSLIEPVVIVILGIGVAFLVMAVLMPIYNISQIQ